MASIFDNWNKKIYIGKLIKVEADDYGNDIKYYDKPKAYFFNIEPSKGATDVAIYGEKISKVYKAIIPFSRYKGKFHEGDIAYLDGATPEGESEEEYGKNGNFVIDSVRPQNLVIAIYFKKIEIGGQSNDN